MLEVGKKRRREDNEDKNPKERRRRKISPNDKKEEIDKYNEMSYDQKMNKYKELTEKKDRLHCDLNIINEELHHFELITQRLKMVDRDISDIISRRRITHPVLIDSILKINDSRISFGGIMAKEMSKMKEFKTQLYTTEIHEYENKIKDIKKSLGDNGKVIQCCICLDFLFDPKNRVPRNCKCKFKEHSEGGKSNYMCWNCITELTKNCSFEDLNCPICREPVSGKKKEPSLSNHNNQYNSDFLRIIRNNIIGMGNNRYP